MKGPRMNFELVQFQPRNDFKAHYHNIIKENFYILEVEIDIVVYGKVNHLKQGQFIHIEPSEVHYCICNLLFKLYDKYKFISQITLSFKESYLY
ncbi:cupin domain-containing protein [Clostridium butyricum]|uniref:cupin domain-containing protein n=2 Tax=Clostridium butyricum TaxID=1492 RepID=UPI003466572C